jgi:hypothetical protein
MRIKNGLYIDEYGHRFYYLNYEYHRDDGPAIEHVSGSKEWFQYGRRHRLDGPALEWHTGAKYWYFHGKQINCKTQEEFEDEIKLAMFW